MPYLFKSSNPIEASFAEAFFREKGFTCQLIPTGLYGLQNYDVAVVEDVDDSIVEELRLRLSEQASAEEPEDEPEEESEEVSSEKNASQVSFEFSALSALVIVAIAVMGFFSFYYYME